MSGEVFDVNDYPIRIDDVVKYEGRYYKVADLDNGIVCLTAIVRMLPTTVTVPTDGSDKFSNIEIVEGYQQVTVLETFKERQKRDVVRPDEAMDA